MKYSVKNSSMASSPICIISSFCFLSFFTIPSQSCHDIDKTALLEFKYKITHDPANLLTTWNISTNCCTSWEGIQCDSTGRVVNVSRSGLFSDEDSITDTSMNGTLSPFLGNLSSLSLLDLSNLKYLTGPIPSELGKLSELAYLFLDTNQLTGSIPSSFGNLSNLKRLFLNDNGLSGSIPNSAFESSTSLFELGFSGNNLSGPIPSTIWSLTSLKNLDVHSNRLSGNIPPIIGNLKQLQNLDFSQNQITGPIPATIGELSKLSLLYLDGNSLTGSIPSSVSKLTSLVFCRLSENKLTGSLPTSIGNLRSIQRLYIHNNKLTGELPASIGKLTALTDLTLSNNQLTGTIPSTFGKLLNLQQLDLSKNHLSGPIPPELAQLKYLQILDLSYNPLNLEGLPAWISKLSNLFRLLLSGTRISGTLTSSIPHSPICNLSDLGYLDLSENQINGMLPDCLGNFSQIYSLNLRNNNFSGTLPSNFTSEQLHTLDLNGNHFEGKIPGIHSRALAYLDLGNNQLQDTFPFTLETLSNLEIVILRSNKLYGPLRRPGTHLAFNSLKVFDISSNYFTGNLPLEPGFGLEAMKSVGFEYLSYPVTSMVVIHKAREVRLNLTFIKKFRAIDMSNNKLQGRIQESIGELFNLTMLNLSSNNFNGLIPSSLENLKQLESLDLSQNKLSGDIPRQLTNIYPLAALNLSYNNLTGRIPDGRQFSTFTNDSFTGNFGLCGKPLSKECGNNADRKPTEAEGNHEDSDNLWSFSWKPVVIGYGCGILMALVIQYFVFTKALMNRWFGNRKR